MRYREIISEDEDDPVLAAIKREQARVNLILAKQRARKAEVEAQVAAELSKPEAPPAPAPEVESAAQKRRRLAQQAPINRLIAFLDADGMNGVGHAGRQRKPEP